MCVQGLLEKAGGLYDRALELAEKLFGPESKNMATSLNNKALLLKKMVRVVDASCVVVGAVESPPRGRAVEEDGALLTILYVLLRMRRTHKTPPSYRASSRRRPLCTRAAVPSRRRSSGQIIQKSPWRSTTRPGC